MKIFGVATGVVRVGSSHRSGPEDAFDVGRARRVGTARVVGVDCGITLKVNVESLASVTGSALAGARLCVICLQERVSKISSRHVSAALQSSGSYVPICVAGGIEVGVSADIAGRHWGRLSLAGKVWIRQEC